MWDLINVINDIKIKNIKNVDNIFLSMFGGSLIVLNDRKGVGIFFFCKYRIWVIYFYYFFFMDSKFWIMDYVLNKDVKVGYVRELIKVDILWSFL